jgi:hypothetical protein
MVDVRYEVIEYRQGKVGQIEVLCNARKLPYRVKETIMDAKSKPRITKDRVLVRHGSHVEQPSEIELQAIIDEGERARNQS